MTGPVHGERERRGSLMERILPDGVVSVEARVDLPDTELFAEEERSLGPAVEDRRREFMTGRACARLALARLGVAPTAIARGAHGEPLWPTGIVGSITHCCDYRACAVARADDVASVGIDAEVHAPLPDGVLDQVASVLERRWVAGQGADRCADRLLFSAKEAVFKAWFPLTGRWLDFDDVGVRFDRESETFTAELLVSGPAVGGRRLRELRGAWAAEDGVLATAIVVGKERGSSSRTGRT